jgi:hypothetical protein
MMMMMIIMMMMMITIIEDRKGTFSLINVSMSSDKYVTKY